MSISRRTLYAAGEPFGDGATRLEAGRLLCGGGGSKSKSSTSAFDGRMVVGEGAIGVGGKNNSAHIALTDDRDFTQNTNLTDARSWSDSSQTSWSDSSQTSINVQTTDADIAKGAFDFASSVDATGGRNYDRLLGLAEGLFERGGQLVTETRDSVASAYSNAYAEAGAALETRAGKISEKTIILVAAGIGAAYLLGRKK